ncbi:KpsF/GutQ family sugar-phosphate isomerase [Agarivorans sp. B2Z047]|uniref:KpsF/GutQ family sugar-phosphate isomerase n=1 Tax=Agarivorans sp. B2Z047 TaxID=2652721 RepID=UPI00128CA15A|nr:KpsF/GutQ family sugar-phosphate isomerase [Agarivorans sp. B2Z047]MPW28735.1 KpsF/GutQ family sugar-phosphate isomerase [Agarivorans sp. B2Z047]UQN41296.1 KpsF/GutQ family sugar-phosphate isomerase [Agarivorans sp. B2Z047]
MSYIPSANRVFDIEAEALLNLKKLIDDSFDSSINAILNTSGRTVICGMGKSGIVGKKIAATLASTGTPSFFMHPGEAFHGDLGMVTPDDVFLAISNSGETEEVLKLLPFLRENKNKLISLTGNPNSTLAKCSHYHLNISVPEEACPLQLAPTSSTTATLAMGDAIAVSLMDARNFKPENFARFHPGGSLGKKLLHRVKDEMVTESLPIVSAGASIKQVISIITEGQLGLAVVVDHRGLVIGLISDGDLRRALDMKFENFARLTSREIMSTSPFYLEQYDLMAEAYNIMENNKINRLLVLEAGKLVGVVKK